MRRNRPVGQQRLRRGFRTVFLGEGNAHTGTPFREISKLSELLRLFPRLAGEPGFEPRQTESESVVLPLHHSPIITQRHQCVRWMSGQSAGAGSCKSPPLLVRRSTRSVRALASTEAGVFGRKGAAVPVPRTGPDVVTACACAKLPPSRWSSRPAAAATGSCSAAPPSPDHESIAARGR